MSTNNGNNGGGPPEDSPGRGPPENPGSRGERFGNGEEYTCPDCDGSVTSYFREDGERNEVPASGWRNYILTAEEESIVTVIECDDCDWREVSTIMVVNRG